ncbi:hypothetical protein B0H19DRAFT_1085131 [Mycena capillaripes]|nr:hypothetical protein B0H19DRAFT_1085131 [Mycena capillaripes]
MTNVSSGSEEDPQITYTNKCAPAKICHLASVLGGHTGYFRIYQKHVSIAEYNTSYPTGNIDQWWIGAVQLFRAGWNGTATCQQQAGSKQEERAGGAEEKWPKAESPGYITTALSPITSNPPNGTSSSDVVIVGLHISNSLLTSELFCTCLLLLLAVPTMGDAERLNNLRFAYHNFHDEVCSALRRMIGNPPQLNTVRDRGLALASAAEQHRALFAPDEYATLQTSVSAMVSDLDLACHESLDPPDAAPLVVARRILTGRRGRPRVEIDVQFLRAALELRGPTGIAPEAGLVEPGAPVFQPQVNAQGVVEIVHRSTAPPVSNISDAELDLLVTVTLEIFPQFGRRMIRGHLKSQGYRVPRHIWLLHHLFLSSVNRDALEWAEAWNSHQLTSRRQRERSPRDLFLFGMLREGPRGISSFLAPDEEEIENINE